MRNKLIAAFFTAVLALGTAHARVRAHVYVGVAPPPPIVEQLTCVLVDHGLLARLEVGQGMARYEPVTPGGEHHHHLVCERCGKLVAFHDPALERAIESLAERLELEVADHEVLLRGACKRCEAPRV